MIRVFLYSAGNLVRTIVVDDYDYLDRHRVAKFTIRSKDKDQYKIPPDKYYIWSGDFLVENIVEED